MKYLTVFFLLTLSNIIMTFAWYWHIKPSNGNYSLWNIVLISWGLAFFEYCIAIPANHFGANSGVRPFELKIMQEIITLLVFAGFAVLYLKEELRLNYLISFIFILAAVYFAFKR